MTTYYSKIGKEDLRLFDGANRTFQRRNSSGSLIDLHTMGNAVDVLQAFGDGTTPAQVDLSQAIVGANGNECTFELAPGTWPITSDLTIPSTVTVHLIRGAAFSVSTGVTLTINGPVFADDTTWYSGAGTVTVASGVSQVTGAAIKAGTTLECVTTLAVGTDATVGGTLSVTGNATLGGDTDIVGNAAVTGTLNVAGQATTADLSASGTLGGKLAFRGAMVYFDSNQSIADSGADALIFDQESYDTSSIHDNSTNPTRLTVPSGVTRVIIKGQVYFSADADGYRSAYVSKNNAATYAGRPIVVVASSGGASDTSIYLASPVLTVTAGDYFQLIAGHNAGNALNVLGLASGLYTWFAMEIVE